MEGAQRVHGGCAESVQRVVVRTCSQSKLKLVRLHGGVCRGVSLQLIRLHGGVCRGVSLQLIALCGGLWWGHVANQNHPRMHGGCMEGVWRGVTPID